MNNEKSRLTNLRVGSQHNNPPLFFVPSVMLCFCGQRVMIPDENHIPGNLFVVVTCTNPLCSEYNKDKRIDLPEYRNYEVLSS